MRERWLVGGIILLVALVVMACGGGGGQQGGTAQQGGTSTAAAAINVTEKEWAIDFPSKEIAAGTVKLSIKNEGAVEHNFVIKEANFEADSIQPGQTKEVSVQLKPGTYTVVCNIPGHEEAGMKTTITVK